MDERRPGYYAVIPADVRYDDRISDKAKLLYGEIAALIGADGFCFASNSYFAKLYKISERTASANISLLQKYGYVDVIQEKDPKTRQIIRRKIFLKVSSCDERPVEEIFYTPGKYFREGIEENFQDTNTSITDIEKENKKEKAKALTDEQLHELFITWITEVAGEGWDRDSKNQVYFALVGFYEPRENKKQQPARTKAAFTALANRLARYSEGSPTVMVDMLERATTAGWKSVFPLGGDHAAAEKPSEGRKRKWL